MAAITFETPKLGSISCYMNWYKVLGFASSNEEVANGLATDRIYEEVKRLAENLPFSLPSDFWRNYSISVLGGRIDIVSRSLGADLTTINFVFNEALKTLREKPLREALLVEKHFLAFLDDFDVAVTKQIEPQGKVLMNEEGSDAGPIVLNIPFCVCRRSALFFELFSKEKREDSSEVVSIILPSPFTIEMFQMYLGIVFYEGSDFGGADLPDDMSVSDRLYLLELSTYLSDEPMSSAIRSDLEEELDSLEDLKEVMEFYNLIETSNKAKIFSLIINNLIHGYASKSQTIEQLLIELRSFESIEDYAKLPLELVLRHFSITDKVLDSLSEFFPSVRSLKSGDSYRFEGCSITCVPKAWLDTLEELDISCNQAFRSLDQIMPRLHEFTARNTTCLENVSGLNGLEHLKSISMNNNLVSIAPAGCLNLEEFYAWSCPITDISGLDGLSKLKKLTLQDTLIKRVPIGCISLQEFSAEDSKQLADVLGLNGLCHLYEIDISDSLIESAPAGCKNLKRFWAGGAKYLTDVSGLAGLEFLEEINVDHSAITKAPKGCVSLISFGASHAKRLVDVSGLDGLLSLQYLDVGYTSIARAPLGCLNLTQFYAEGACTLKDIKEIEQLPRLLFLKAEESLSSPALWMQSSWLYSFERESPERVKSLFSALHVRIQNQLKWGFWFYSGMPKGDFDFGSTLFNKDPKDPIVQKTLKKADYEGWPLIAPEVIKDLFFFKIELGKAKGDPIKRIAAFRSLSKKSKKLIVKAVEVACGSDGNQLIKENPNTPYLDKVITEMLEQIEAHS